MNVSLCVKSSSHFIVEVKSALSPHALEIGVFYFVLRGGTVFIGMPYCPAAAATKVLFVDEVITGLLCALQPPINS